MNPRPNISLINSLIRITIGLTILSWSTAKLVKYPWRDSYLMMALLGGMKVAEGIVRFCPLVALFERSQELMQEQKDENSQENDQMIPYNPT